MSVEKTCARKIPYRRLGDAKGEMIRLWEKNGMRLYPYQCPVPLYTEPHYHLTSKQPEATKT